LARRGICPGAIDRGGIRAHGRGWIYPITPGYAEYRFKRYPDRKGAKYFWCDADGHKGNQPDPLPLYDPLGDLTRHIAAADGVVILAAGEPDVWACWSADIFNVTCTLTGEGVIPPTLIDNLRAAGATTVRVYPDCDDAGLKHAEKLRAAFAGSGIALEIYGLPFEHGSKSDINTLLLKVGADQLRAALYACDPLPLPDPSPYDAYHNQSERKTAPPSAYADLYERWCIEVVEAAAVATWGIAPPNGNGWSRRNFRSPVRDDGQNPDCSWSYSAHGFYDHAAGQFYTAEQCAELLNVQSWDDYKRDHAPAPQPARVEVVAQFAGETLNYYPDGLPLTVIELLNGLHRNQWVHVERNDILNAGAFVALWRYGMNW
jgi:hypothetical protein